MNTTRSRRGRRKRSAEDKHLSGTIQDLVRGAIEERELIRAEVMSDHWRQIASRRDDVYWFRVIHLHGRTLSKQQAIEFLTKNANDKRVVREIQRVCGDLCRCCGWDTRQALKFLLTGRAPMVQPIQVETLTRAISIWGSSARVTVTFDLWLSSSTIMQVVTCLRRIAGQQDKRLLEEKTLRLAEFVSGTMSGQEKLSQRAYMARWNDDYPEWRYTDARHFVRDCRNAKVAVLFMNRGAPEIGSGEEYLGAF